MAAAAAVEVAALSRSRPPMSRVVAIDGPSGAGKSTVGHALAQRIDATFVDTGLMYRALTLAALERGIDVDDGAGARRLAETVRDRRSSSPRPDQTDRLETVLLDGRDVTDDVRTPARRPRRELGEPSCRGSRRDAWRPARDGRAGDVVMVGRDIGTVVLPERDAEGVS